MSWQKLGHVYVAGGDGRGPRTHAFLPDAVDARRQPIRVYVAFLDPHSVGRLGYVDVAADDPTRVLERLRASRSLRSAGRGVRRKRRQPTVASCPATAAALPVLRRLAARRAGAVLPVHGCSPSARRRSTVPRAAPAAGARPQRRRAVVRAGAFVSGRDGALADVVRGRRRWIESSRRLRADATAAVPRIAGPGPLGPAGGDVPARRPRPTRFGFGRPYVLPTATGYQMWCASGSRSGLPPGPRGVADGRVGAPRRRGRPRRVAERLGLGNGLLPPRVADVGDTRTCFTTATTTDRRASASPSGTGECSTVVHYDGSWKDRVERVRGRGQERRCSSSTATTWTTTPTGSPTTRCRHARGRRPVAMLPASVRDRLRQPRRVDVRRPPRGRARDHGGRPSTPSARSSAMRAHRGRRRAPGAQARAAHLPPRPGGGGAVRAERARCAPARAATSRPPCPRARARATRRSAAAPSAAVTRHEPRSRPVEMRLEEFMALLREVLLARHGVEPVHGGRGAAPARDALPGGDHALHGDGRARGVAGRGRGVRDARRSRTRSTSPRREEGREPRTRRTRSSIIVLEEVYRTKPWFDFGISNERDGTLNGGLMRNKEGFGARAVVHDRYVLEIA